MPVVPLLAAGALAAGTIYAGTRGGPGCAHFVPIGDDLEGGIDDRSMPPGKGEDTDDRRDA